MRAKLVLRYGEQVWWTVVTEIGDRFAIVEPRERWNIEAMTDFGEDMNNVQRHIEQGGAVLSLMPSLRGLLYGVKVEDHTAGLVQMFRVTWEREEPQYHAPWGSWDSVPESWDPLLSQQRAEMGGAS